MNDRLRRGYPFWHGLGGQHAKTFLNIDLHVHKSLSTFLCPPTQPPQPTLQNWLFLIYATALIGVTHFPMDLGSACQDLSEKVKHATLACMWVLFVVTKFVALLYDSSFHSGNSVIFCIRAKYLELIKLANWNDFFFLKIDFDFRSFMKCNHTF